MQIKPQLDQLGIRLVAVGTGSKLFARNFKESSGFDGEVFLDPEANTFKAIDLPRLSLWAAIKRFMMSWTNLSFYRSIESKYPGNDMKGDGQQTGGVFVVGPGKESPLLYSFRENDHEATEFAINDEILQACSQDVSEKN